MVNILPGCSHNDMSCQTTLLRSTSVISFIGSSLQNQVALQKIFERQLIVQYELECAVGCIFLQSYAKVVC